MSSAAARRSTPRSGRCRRRPRASWAGASLRTSTGSSLPTAASVCAARPTRASSDMIGLPAVISVTEGINEGTGQRKHDVEATDTAGRIVVRTAADLVDDVVEDDPRFGQTGSLTRVLAIKDVTPERRGEILPGPEEAAGRILELLAAVEGPPALLGEAAAARREARAWLRLDGCRADRKRRAAFPARAARKGQRAGREARRPQRRPHPRERARGGKPRGRALRRRACRPRRRRGSRRVPPGDPRRGAPPGRRAGEAARAP